MEDFNESKGKGSFPALITPGYQTAKNANMLASNVSRLTLFYCVILLLQKTAMVYSTTSIQSLETICIMWFQYVESSNIFFIFCRKVSDM